MFLKQLELRETDLRNDNISVLNILSSPTLSLSHLTNITGVDVARLSLPGLRDADGLCLYLKKRQNSIWRLR